MMVYILVFFFFFRSPIYSLAITGDTFVATGDDDGVLKVCFDVSAMLKHVDIAAICYCM